MTVEKLLRALSNPGIPRDWLVVVAAPDGSGLAEVKRFSRREITVEGEPEDTLIRVLVIGE